MLNHAYNQRCFISVQLMPRYISKLSICRLMLRFSVVGCRLWRRQPCSPPLDPRCHLHMLCIDVAIFR